MTAGVVSGAGPLAALSSASETTDPPETTETTTSSDSTETSPSESDTTETTSTDGDSTEETTPDTEPSPPDPLTGVPCPQAGTETLATDHASYPPGTIATISGTGFAPSCDVEFKVTRPDAVVEWGIVATKVDGSVTYEYSVPPPPGVLGTYKADAVGLDGTVLASVEFNDGPEILDPDVAPAYVAGGGVRQFSILVRNTGDTTHRCIRVTLPSGYTTISVLGSAASSGSFASSISGQVVSLTNSTGIAPGSGWGRFDIQATAPASNSTDWQFRGWSNTACSSDGTSTELVQVIAGAQPADRRYTAAFVGTPDFATGASITMTKSSDSQSSKIEYFSLALPRCFSGINVTSAGSNGANPWTATVVDHFIRWRDSSSGELDDNQTVTVTFTANTAGCAAGTYTFWSTGWVDNTGSSDDASKLFTTSTHPTATIGAAANQPPLVDLNGALAGADTSATFTEDQATPTTLAADATVNDADDTNLESATITLTNRPDGAAESLAVSGCHASVSVAAYNSATGVLALTGTSSLANYQACLRLVTYGNSSQNPTTTNRSVTFVAHDGTDPSTARTATVTVTAVDDAPTAVDDAATVGEDSGATTVNVLANDTDPDGGTKQIASVTQPANGSVVVAGDNLSLTYQPNANYCNGGSPTDTFTYTLNGNSQATVRMTVTCVNDAPTCGDVSIAVSEDGPAGATAPSCTDVDTPASSLTYTVTQPTKGVSSFASGNLGFDPDGDFEALDTGESDTTNGDFTYKANDGTTDSAAANVNVTVNGANDAPVCQNDSITTDENTAGSTAANCSDVDVEPLTITVTQPTKGVAGYSNPNLTFNPNGQYEALDTGESDTTNGDFTYKANDGTVDSNTANVAVTVNGVNDAPVLTLSQASYTGQYSDPIDTSAAAGLQPIGISATDVDDTGAELSFTVTVSPACTVATTLPDDITKTDSAGNAVLPGTRTTNISGRFDVIPAAYARCIVVSDGTSTDSETLTLNVSKENATVLDIEPTLVLVGQPVTEKGTFVEENDGFPSSTLTTHASAFGATNVKFDLTPVGAGSNGKNCTDTNGVATSSGAVECTTAITGLLSDVYEVTASSSSSWFSVSGIGTLSVYDPASGFATGGGHLLWNGWKVNFGFVGKQVNKSLKGSILTVIHKPEGPYVVKTNAFTGLAINKVGTTTAWYVSMTGKATYAYPDGYANPGCSGGERKCGNFAVLLYAEDIAEPGASVDKYRLRVTNPNGAPAFEIPLTVIGGGNVQVPHK